MNYYSRILEPSHAVIRPSAEETVISLNEHEIRQSFQRLLPSEIRLLFRHNIFPIVWSPRGTLYAAAGRHAQAEAIRLGLPIAANADRDLVRKVITDVYGRKMGRHAIFNLARCFPLLSAKNCKARSSILLMLLGIIAVDLAALPLGIASASIVALWSLFFLAVILLRLMSLIGSPRSSFLPRADLSDAELPTYSVLVPLFRETGMLGQLIQALSALDYPTSKLQIILVVEEVDLEMRRALADRRLPEFFEIVVVPPGGPQTKPKALNFALPLVRGDLITVYDAEDIPDPKQLRVAAETFTASSPDLACLQAELRISADKSGWLGRQFAIEYASLFGLILPLLASLKLPIPLGGTSNHIRASVLRDVGAWDPFNVTEDADLGLRLARAGYTTGVLDSFTYESATAGLGNWLAQRARWLKGWMQTWLVHMRQPAKLRSEIGWAGFWTVQALLLGMIVSSLFHPFFLIAAIDQIMLAKAFSENSTWISAFIISTYVVVFLVGYGVTIEAGRRGLRQRNVRHWYLSLLSMPVYWLLISVAAWRAAWELVWKPFAWNKTNHVNATLPNLNDGSSNH